MAKSQWLMATPLAATNAKANTPLFPFLARLMRGENLSRVEAGLFLSALINPDVTDAQIAVALAALTVKGETVDELAGMAEAMRERAVQLRSRHDRFVDTAGTGSSAVKTFNVSTATAFVPNRERRNPCRAASSRAWLAPLSLSRSGSPPNRRSTGARSHDW